MCGISAVFSRKANTRDRNDLDLMHQTIYHRGPDTEGFLSWKYGDKLELITGKKSVVPGNILLAHRRLSIIDLSETATQPMISPDERCAIVYNGEIYNFSLLRDKLLFQGYSFKTHSDTEIILNGYMCWGIDILLEKIEGMFSFILIDKLLEKAFICRDPFGIKPLYYREESNRILFCSELKGLLALNEKKVLNPQKSYDYLRFGLTDYDEETLVQDYKIFPAAHYAILDLRSLSIKKYSYWEPRIQDRNIAFEEAKKEVQDIFLRNVKEHMVSDVPLSATLSGGIDSSAVVMAMKKFKNDLSFPTFSYCADDPHISEEKWIEVIKDATDCKNHKIYLDSFLSSEKIEELIYIQDEPFGSTSIYAQYSIFNSIKQNKIKVVLDGQGADEILGGYEAYFSTKLSSLLKQGQFCAVQRFLRNYSKNTEQSLLTLLKKTIAKSAPLWFSSKIRNFSKDRLDPLWLESAWIEKNQIHLRDLGNMDARFTLKHHLASSLTKTVLPSLLRYQDRNSMHYSIESRVPFLTREFVDFIYSLPEELLISAEGITKHIFRESMRGLVPDEILDRKNKIGFSTPEKKLLKNLSPWVEKVLESDVARSLTFLKINLIRQEWYAILEGKKPYRGHIWRCINFIKWAEVYKISHEI